MRMPIMKMVSLAILLLLLVSCATVSVVDTWRAPDLGGRKFHKLLVVNVTRNSTIRQVNEDVLAAELAAHGVAAVPSHTVLVSAYGPDRKALAGAVAASGADGVLTIQLVNRERRTDVEPGYTSGYPGGYPGYWPPADYYSWDLYNYYGSGIFYEPPVVRTYEVATIQVSLFDAASSRLLWAVTTETAEPGRTLAIGKELAKIVISRLMKAGLI